MDLRRPEDVAKLRGLSVKQVLGLDLQEAAAKQTNGAPEDGGESAGASDEVAVATAEPADPSAPPPADTGSEAEDVGGGTPEDVGGGTPEDVGGDTPDSADAPAEGESNG
jgi:hypothetical protein